MNRAATPAAQAPVKRFAKATKACAVQAATYGACVGKRYQDVQRGMCAEEFKAFKECVQTQMGRKW